MDLTPIGQRADVRFANAAIRVTRRFTYEQVTEILLENGQSDMTPPTNDAGGPGATAAAHARPGDDPAQAPDQARLAGADDAGDRSWSTTSKGKVSGAHFRKHDISHQIVEEFMLAANEAVAEHLDDQGVAFLRRVHPAPDETKLEAFAEFARILGYKIKSETDRFTLQRILQQSADKPEMHAVHYALLRSLKQATYSPVKDDHYALASENYCHFTSPIRRYPDLVVHRLLDQLLRRGKAGSAFDELVALGDHCSKMERRAETAERELVKLKLLVYMSERLGTELEAVITGVADYGFFAQAEDAAGRGPGPHQHAAGRLLLFRRGVAQPDRPADEADAIGSATR